MHILLINNSPIPVYGYGGTERVIWDLGKTLVQLGHRVSYLVPDGSSCDFGHVLPIRPDAPWEGQIPADVDIAHLVQPPHRAEPALSGHRARQRAQAQAAAAEHRVPLA